MDVFPMVGGESVATLLHSQQDKLLPRYVAQNAECADTRWHTGTP